MLPQDEIELDFRSWLERERWKDITAAFMAGRAYRMITGTDLILKDNTNKALP